MHPIAGTRRGLGLYAIAWIPLALLLGYLLRATGLGWAEAIALVVPLAPLYALMCLAAWFPCRAMPIPKTGLVRLATTHVVAGTQISGLWMLLAMGYVAVIVPFEHGFADGMQIKPHLLGLSQHAGLYKTLFGIGLLLYFLSAAMMYVLIAMQQSHDAERRESEARLLARDAELRALKAQINPHFLFNSLHSISALTAVDPKKAREMSITLAEFLRKTLGLGEKELIPLCEEVALLRNYLVVEKVRFGERLRVEEKVTEQAAGCLIPPLILQPLVENAIKHGIANLPEGGTVSLMAERQDGSLRVAIENDYDPDYVPKRRNGIGMANVRERLVARYGKNATFEASIFGPRFRVWLTLPAEVTR